MEFKLFLEMRFDIFLCKLSYDGRERKTYAALLGHCISAVILQAVKLTSSEAAKRTGQ
jgi:hypothetical protein